MSDTRIDAEKLPRQPGLYWMIRDGDDDPQLTWFGGVRRLADGRERVVLRMALRGRVILYQPEYNPRFSGPLEPPPELLGNYEALHVGEEV